MPLNESEIIQKMYSGDKFSNLLGIKVLDTAKGYCRLQMSVSNDMLNGFDILHGAVSYALADSCLAFASNSHGRVSVSLNAKMSYTEPARLGDILTAESKEISVNNRIAIYDVFIKNQNDVVIGVFRGTVYRTKKEF